MPRIGVISLVACFFLVATTLITDSRGQVPRGQAGQKGKTSKSGETGESPKGGEGGETAKGGPRGGRGGFGGFGGFGGRGLGGSPFDMLTRPAIQEELKLSVKQKDTIEKLDTQRDQSRRTMRDSMRNLAAANKASRQNRANTQNGPAANNNNGLNSNYNLGFGTNGFSNNDNSLGFGTNGFTVNNNANAGPGPATGRDNRNNFGGGPPGGAIWGEMAALDRQVEASALKILDRRQRERLKQILLQRDGPLGVAKPETAAALNLSEEQVQAVQETLVAMRTQQRELMTAQRQMFRPPGGNNNGRGGFDREAMRARMQTPEFQAQMEAMRKQTESINQQAIRQVGKILRPKQKQAFNRMLGAPFDFEKLRGGNDRGRQGPAPGEPTSSETTKAGSAPAEKAGGSPASKADPKGASKTKSSTQATKGRRVTGR